MQESGLVISPGAYESAANGGESGAEMWNLRSLMFILCFLPGIAMPGGAEDRSQRFVALMSRLPEGVLGAQSPTMPEFVDFEAARWVADMQAKAGPGAVEPASHRVLGGPFADQPKGADWTGTVGFAPTDLKAAALLRAPPDDAMALLLAAEAMPHVGPALLANGYTATEDKGFPAFWRGEKDLSVDLAATNPDDPFAFPMAKSSRIALVDDVLLQAASWPRLESLQASASTSPVLTALAMALDLPDWEERRLVQAVLVSDPMLLAPGIQMDESPMPTADPSGAVPYWSNLLLADLGGEGRDLTLIILLYVTQADAETAAKAMDKALGDEPLAAFGGQSLTDAIGPGTARVSGDGPYLAIYALETPPDVPSPGTLRNRGFDVLLRAIYQREFSVLGPALP